MIKILPLTFLSIFLGMIILNLRFSLQSNDEITKIYYIVNINEQYSEQGGIYRGSGLSLLP